MRVRHVRHGGIERGQRRGVVRLAEERQQRGDVIGRGGFVEADADRLGIDAAQIERRGGKRRVTTTVVWAVPFPRET